MHRLNRNPLTSCLYILSARLITPDLMETPLDRQLHSRPRKGPPVAHNLDVYKKMHKLNYSAKWKQANVSTNSVNTSKTELRVTHHEGRFDKAGMYRDFLYGNDRRLANMCGVLLTATAVGIFFYTIDFLGSDKWDMPAPLLKKPDLIRELNNNIEKDPVKTPA